jgi:hypothetical protein
MAALERTCAGTLSSPSAESNSPFQVDPRAQRGNTDCTAGVASRAMGLSFFACLVSRVCAVLVSYSTVEPPRRPSSDPKRERREKKCETAVGMALELELRFFPLRILLEATFIWRPVVILWGWRRIRRRFPQKKDSTRRGRDQAGCTGGSAVGPSKGGRGESNYF